jgi:hypothetical protein
MVYKQVLEEHTVNPRTKLNLNLTHILQDLQHLCSYYVVVLQFHIPSVVVEAA